MVKLEPDRTATLEVYRCGNRHWHYMPHKYDNSAWYIPWYRCELVRLYPVPLLFPRPEVTLRQIMLLTIPRLASFRGHQISLLGNSVRTRPWKRTVPCQRKTRERVLLLERQPWRGDVHGTVRQDGYNALSRGGVEQDSLGRCKRSATGIREIAFRQG